MPANKKPLNIYVRTWHYAPDSRVTHNFYCRRMQFTAQELHKANVIEVPVKNPTLFMQERTFTEKKLVTPPFAQITYQHNGKKIFYQQHYPYSEIIEQRQDGMLMPGTAERSRGISAEWEIKIFQYLLSKYAADTPVIQVMPSPHRKKQFAKARLADGATLAEHLAAFQKLAQRNRQKAEYIDTGSGI